MNNKIIYSIILFLFQSISVHLFAQCTPDTTLKSSGIFPAELSAAIETKPYAQIIQFRMPKDTMVSQFGFPILASIDSIIVTKVNGLPANFNYQCNQTNCKANGGETGCILLSGLPKNGQQGVYPLSVVFKVYAHALTIKQTIEDSVTRYSLTVNAATALQENIANSQLSIYPIPSNGIVSIESSESLTASTIHLYDMKMQEVYPASIVRNSSNQLDMNLSNLQEGCYTIVLQSGAQTIRKKIVLYH